MTMDRLSNGNIANMLTDNGDGDGCIPSTEVERRELRFRDQFVKNGVQYSLTREAIVSTILTSTTWTQIKIPLKRKFEQMVSYADIL